MKLRENVRKRESETGGKVRRVLGYSQECCMTGSAMRHKCSNYYRLSLLCNIASSPLAQSLSPLFSLSLSLSLPCSLCLLTMSNESTAVSPEDSFGLCVICSHGIQDLYNGPQTSPLIGIYAGRNGRFKDRSLGAYSGLSAHAGLFHCSHLT